MKLETNRLILRYLTEADFAAVHSYASKKENTIFMLFGPNTEEQTRGFINFAIGKSKENPITSYQFGVTLKRTGELIGSCDLHFEGNEGEVGWLLNLNYWQQGYGTELGQELLRFGFEELNLKRIIATCDAENIGSRKLMEKIGMKFVKCVKDARPPHKNSTKEFGDEMTYAIGKCDT